MFQRNRQKDKTINKEQKLQKGQTVIYQGEEASILDVKPVLTIKVKNKGHIVCGDTLHNEIYLESV